MLEFLPHLLFENSAVTTQVLAPPGSGKTTLMKSIAGLLPQKNVKSGSVKYNGCGAKEAPFSVPQVVGYVPEYDLHMAQLTVRETLEFARRAVEEVSFTMHGRAMPCSFSPNCCSRIQRSTICPPTLLAKTKHSKC